MVILTTLQTLSPSVLSCSALALSSAVGWAAVDPPLVYKEINTSKQFFGNTQMWKVKHASKTYLLFSLNTGSHNHVCIWISDLNKHGFLHFSLHFPLTVVWVSIEMTCTWTCMKHPRHCLVHRFPNHVKFITNTT